jgi:hypothetical protein
MAIDHAAESLVPFNAAPKIIPGRPHISTLHRWRLRGCRGVRLETCLVGGRRYTSEEAIARFIAATSAAAEGSPPPPLQSRRAKVAQALADLEDAGY